jgi:hypothetical protein
MKNFLYLIQGRKENVLKYSYLQNSNSDLFVCTFDVEIKNGELDFFANFFYPQSTWAEGRNKQLEIAKNFRHKYLYYIFIDDDVVFVKGSFYDFEKLLLQHRPAVGVPLLTIIKKSNKYNVKLNIQHPVAIDQQMQAYHFDVLEQSIVMPLVTKFDSLSWWYSCEINSYLILSKYRGYIMQFNTVQVDNVGHLWDNETKISLDSSSIYIGGTTPEGIEKIKIFIEDKYGDQPKIRNSLFHDTNFSKYYYLPKGKFLIKFYFDNFKKGKLKNILKQFQLRLKNLVNKYPLNVVLNEKQFSSFEIDTKK